MCASILHTRKELLFNLNEQHDRRLDSYVRWLGTANYYKHRDSYIGTLILQIWELYDQLKYPGNRYGFWEDINEISKLSCCKRFVSWAEMMVLANWTPFATYLRCKLKIGIFNEDYWNTCGQCGCQYYKTNVHPHSGATVK